MPKRFRLISLVLLLVALVACQQAAPGGGSVTAVPATPTPTPNISSPLIGTYVTTITSHDIAGHPELDTGYQKENAGGMALPGMWYLTYRRDGIWIAQGSAEWGRQYIGTGVYTITQKQVTLLTDSKCLEYYVPYFGPTAQFATYSWQLSGKTLLLQTAKDLCIPRKIILASHPWTRQN